MLPHWKLEIINEISSLASSEFELTQEEIQQEKVARRRSLKLSLEAMQDVKNTLIKHVDQTFLDSVRRTLSLPWKFERRPIHSE